MSPYFIILQCSAKKSYLKTVVLSRWCQKTVEISPHLFPFEPLEARRLQTSNTLLGLLSSKVRAYKYFLEFTPNLVEFTTYNI